MPFQLKPLAEPIPTDAQGQNNPMTNQAADTFPTGLGQLYTGPTPAIESTWGSVKALYR
ncbi:MAG: hypothetical protein R3E12_19750 [Candidatus Eisenbacteria bacterium]